MKAAHDLAVTLDNKDSGRVWILFDSTYFNGW